MMKTNQVFVQLLSHQIISEPQFDALKTDAETRPISVHWEIRTLLLLGISCLSIGLGTLVYKNIDTIGHQAIIAVIALATIVCGVFVYKKRMPFLISEEQKEQLMPDTILLLGCTLFLILEGYLQYQYQFFGTRYGLAALIPTIVFAFCAYRFDHKGVLTMAMTAFTSWAGLSVTPLSIFNENVFHNEQTLIQTGVIVGIVLILSGLLLNNRRIKPHFTFSYLMFGYNLACLSSIYGTSVSEIPYSLLCLGFATLGIWYALRERSLFFLLAGAIYGYIAFTILLIELVENSFNGEAWMLYGILSCAVIIVFFLNYKKWLSE